MRRATVPLLVVALGTVALAEPAAAASPLRPCSSHSLVECARITVPIDRSGSVPGTIPLLVERLRTGSSPHRGAVIALAGGPGQAAVPLLGDFAAVIGPALRARDLVTFDQRGTGRSGLLRCPTLEKVEVGDVDEAVNACAAALGPKRRFYTTWDSAQDIEAVRQAIGVDKVTLYGTSYGTKLALAYAQLYPSHVERLVLDSVVPLDGPDPFELDTFAAIPGVLRALCSDRLCERITNDPIGDLSALVKQLEQRSISGYVVGGDGKRRARRLGRLRLLRILFGGDLDPGLRAAFPGAAQSALRGDDAPLLRLAHRSQLEDAQIEKPQIFSPALFVATSCEEGPLPWQPISPFLDRWGQAIDKAALIPDSAFAPFDRATGRASDQLRLCAHWPATGPAPVPPTGPLPNVPTLILSGQDDLRTPAADAAAVAAQIPQATKIVLPQTGHAALLNDLSGCADRALRLFFRDRPVPVQCPKQDRELARFLLVFLYPPEPVAPTSLNEIRAAPGLPSRVGRTLRATELTFFDAFEQLLGASVTAGNQHSGVLRVGGLRSGRLLLRVRGRLELVIDHYSYVPGVRVSATSDLERQSERFRVTGSTAAHGFLKFDFAHNRITGRLNGTRVRLRLGHELDLLGQTLAQGPLGKSGMPEIRDGCCPLIG